MANLNSLDCSIQDLEVYRFLLVDKPEAYCPEWTNMMMHSGAEGIREHLHDRHRLSAEVCNQLSNDNCYRLHDQLHDRKNEEC